MSTLTQPADAVQEVVTPVESGSLDSISVWDYIQGEKVFKLVEQPPEVQIAIIKRALSEVPILHMDFLRIHKFHQRVSPPTLSYFQHPGNGKKEIGVNDKMVYLDLDGDRRSRFGGIMDTTTPDQYCRRGYFLRDDGALILRETTSRIIGAVIENNNPKSVVFRHVVDGDFALMVEKKATPEFLLSLLRLCSEQVQGLRSREQVIVSRRQDLVGLCNRCHVYQ